MIVRGAERHIIVVMILMMVGVLLSYLISIILAVLLIVMMIIFRDPDIQVATGVVSPVDGRVVDVDEGSKSMLIKMDWLGKRVLRAPISGRQEICCQDALINEGCRISWVRASVQSPLFIIRAPNISCELSLLGNKKLGIYRRSSDYLLRGDRLGFLARGIVKVQLNGDGVRILAKRGRTVLSGESTIARLSQPPAEL